MAGATVSRQAHAVAANAASDPQLKGFPILIIIEILMQVIPMIIKCMAEKNAKELQGRLSAEYNATSNEYHPDTLHQVTKLVKWQALMQLHPVNTAKAEVIAKAALDQARTQPEAEIATMIHEVEMPMAAIMP